MAIPKYDKLRISALKLLLSGHSMKLRDFLEPLAKEFKLTEEEINEILIN